MIQGSYVALVTPFRDGEVDCAALENLVDWHVEQGTHGLVPCGTTGESPTLSMEEHAKVIDIVIKRSGGRLPVMAGTGANSTSEAIHLTRAAAEMGADACLLVSPYYNKPEPEGMYRHFKAIAECTEVPLVLYNVPSRTGREIALETVFRLAEIENIVGLKAAGGDTDRVAEVVRKTGLDVLSGDDSMTLPFMAVGARGVISVAANLVPADVAKMVTKALAGDYAAAREMHLKMFPVFKAMFIESNPIPVKAAMAMAGLVGPEMRLPLCEPAEPHRAQIENILREYGVLA